MGCDAAQNYVPSPKQWTAWRAASVMLQLYGTYCTVEENYFGFCISIVGTMDSSESEIDVSPFLHER